MTLKEKFNDLVPKEFGGMQEPLLTDCEKIADDYAIEFAEWVEKLKSSEIDTIDYDLYLRYNTKELLEIFKKEKGYD